LKRKFVKRQKLGPVSVLISKPTNDDELLESIGIHVDYAEALSQGELFGAEVIELSEHQASRRKWP
jgi:hypothetical protein